MQAAGQPIRGPTPVMYHPRRVRAPDDVTSFGPSTAHEANMTRANDPAPGDATSGQESDRRRSTVAFLGKPRVTIGTDGVPRVKFSLVNKGPASVDVSFDVKIDGRTVRIEEPSVSLGAGSDVQSITLDLPVQTEVGRSTSVTVAAKTVNGTVLAVGSSGIGMSIPLVVGAIAISGAAWFGYQAFAAPEEPPRALGTGDVQVTLAWSEPVDLDLHVTDPVGERIYHGDKRSDSGGTLDVDACAALTDCTAGQLHVENVYWPTGGAPAGDYEAVVDHYNGTEAADYELTVRINEEVFDVITGTLQPGDTSSVYPFAR